jgi:hypothetical protein
MGRRELCVGFRGGGGCVVAILGRRICRGGLESREVVVSEAEMGCEDEDEHTCFGLFEESRESGCWVGHGECM